MNSFDLLKKRLYSSFTFLEQLPMGGEQLPRASKYQRASQSFKISKSFPELQNIKESEAVYCF
jgi:ABC-type branched-subunit amino acid transport system ATPase component